MKKSIVTILLLVIATVSLSAQNYDDMVSRGMDYAEANDYAAAAASFQAALRKEPANGSNIMVMVNLASMQRHLGELEDALVLYNIALENYPKNIFFLHNRAALYCEMDRFEDAKRDYNAILLYDDMDIEAIYRRGLLYLEEKDLMAAEEDFEKVLDRAPKHVGAKMGMGMAMKYRNEWKEAEELYTDLIFKHKTNPTLYYNRAECYLALNKLARMQEDLTKAANLGYNDPSIHVLRGRLFLAQYDKRLAKESFLKAKEEGMDNSVVDDLLKLCR